MSVYLGVSRNLAFLKLKPGEPNFWCVGGASRDAKSGDLILLYFPVAVSRTTNGIGQLYKITSAPVVVERSPCASRGMAHVDTELLWNLQTLVTAKDMKAHPIMRDWPPLARSLQGVTFAVSDRFWPHLRSMIVERDPESEKFLEPA